MAAAGGVGELRRLARDLVFALPEGDPATARLELLLWGIVRELERVDERVEQLVEDVMQGRNHEPKEGLHDRSSTRTRRWEPRPLRPAPQLDHNAGI